MAELLTDKEIDTALESLEGWTREGNTLVREVPVTAGGYRAFHEAVMNEAEVINHHPDMEETPAGAHVSLWTHSAGGVTAKDVELAARIDHVISGAARDRASR